MSTPGSALVGYAILRANYNAQAPNYLDNFTPFVMAAIANSGSPVAERSTVSDLIREMFGLNIPELVLPRLLRKTKKEGYTEPVGNSAIRLTAKAQNELPDLNAEVAQYRNRQAELVTLLAAFIENRFPDHITLTTRDLAAHLAEFFDKNAAPLLGASLGDGQQVTSPEVGLDYVVASFVDHLHRTDQVRFSYVVEAAKGAMLASVLELDTSSMSESLNRLTLVLDSPVAMDALGYHGALPERAIRHVLQMAHEQGAKLAIFRHSISELDGILESIEASVRRGTQSRSTSRGYLHFAESGASPADVAMLRERLEDSLAALEISVLDRPGDYYRYGLDETKLEEMIQDRVGYLQDAARVNDVRSLSAIHRMRRGSRSHAIERCTALLISSNGNLVRGARDFNNGPVFPLAATVEAVASILWVRSPALATDAPREIVLASAYAGMQPSPILWRRYLEELEHLENSGTVSPDDAIILRATSVGRDALMRETLGDENALDTDLPLVVLKRVQSSISTPLQHEVETLKTRLAEAETRADNTTQDKDREAFVRQEAQEEVEASRNTIDAMQEEILQIQTAEQDRIHRIRNRAAKFTHRWVVGLTWAVRIIVVVASTWLIWSLSSSNDYPYGSLSWALAIVGVLGFIVTFLPQVTRSASRWEENWAARRAMAKLLDVGYPLVEPDSAKPSTE